MTTSKCGFTITEILVYIGLFAIILTILTEILMSLLKVQLESESISAIDQDSRYIISRLNYDIARAEAITLPASLGAQGNTLRLTINGHTYDYTQTNSNLVLSINSALPKLVNSFDTTVTNLNFQRLGNSGGFNSVSVNLTLTSRANRISGPEIKNINTIISLRPNP